MCLCDFGTLFYIGANNGWQNYEQKNTTTSGKLITAVCASYGYVYTGCPRRNGQNFGRVFLMLNYTDITQNPYIQS